MNLDKPGLQTAIENAFNVAITNTTDTPGAASALAASIADAIDTYVRGIAITYTSGLVDSSGPVTGTFGYSIN